MKMTFEERFEAKVDRSDGPDGCHLWTASKGRDGYGRFGVTRSLISHIKTGHTWRHHDAAQQCL
jgi:hypothetical protein